MANIFNIAGTWRVLSGQNDWKGMLSPLDVDLRRYIIHYGQMAQATYDSFIKEKASRHAGDCRYNMKNFFSMVGLGVNNPYKYEVTKYLYATAGVSLPPPDLILSSLSRESSPKESNRIGYVAVATDEAKTLLGRRDIVIAWRGTEQPLEWLNDLQFLPVPVADLLRDPSDNAMVHGGFYSIYTSTNPKSSHNKSSVRDQVLNEVRRLVDQFKDEDISITVTGHSLGAALATINAVDIVANKDNIPTSQSPNKACLVTAMVFASPRAGDLNFKKTYSKYEQLRCLRIRNNLDIVPTQPPIGFAHVGEVLDIDTTKSPFLKPSQDPADFHNLEVYLHGVAGTQGSNAGFKLAIDRDIALLNKGGYRLKSEYLVPPAWWVEKNKGMVQQENGAWKLVDYDL